MPKNARMRTRTQAPCSRAELRDTSVARPSRMLASYLARDVSASILTPTSPPLTTPTRVRARSISPSDTHAAYVQYARDGPSRYSGSNYITYIRRCVAVGSVDAGGKGETLSEGKPLYTQSRVLRGWVDSERIGNNGPSDSFLLAHLHPYACTHEQVSASHGLPDLHDTTLLCAWGPIARVMDDPA